MRILVFFLFISLTLSAQTQLSPVGDQMIQLASSLRTYQSREELKGFQKSISEVNAPELEFARAFVVSAIQSRRFLLEKQFLEVKNEADLTYCYTVIELSKYFDIIDAKKNEITLNQLINRPRSRNLQLTVYYDFLFKQAIHPTKDYGYRNQRFFLNDISLASPQEKGVFFLIAMSHYYKLIIKPLKIDSPPNIEVAANWLIYFPSFENKPYYYYDQFNFESYKAAGQDFKRFFINQYYELLLSHLFVLKESSAKVSKIDDLLNNSILLNQTYYNFANEDTQKLLKDLYSNSNAIASPSGSSDSVLKKGKALLQKEDFTGAISILKTGLEQAPDNFKLLNQLGMTYHLAGDYSSASESFKKVIDMAPASPFGFYGLGNTYYKSENYIEALKVTKKALTRFEELNPEELFKALGLLSMIYNKLGDTKNAKSYLKKAEKAGFVHPQD